MVKSSLPSRTPAVRNERKLVRWTGDIPEGLAEYLDRQRPWDRRELYGTVGRFRPVRQLLRIARRLHAILEQGPSRAASGYWSFEDVLQFRNELTTRIAALQRRVNEIAVQARVIRPVEKIERGDKHGHSTDRHVG